MTKRVVISELGAFKLFPELVSQMADNKASSYELGLVYWLILHYTGS